MKSKIKSNSEHLSGFVTLYINALWGVVIEVVVQRCSVKKVFLEISQNSQENTYTRVSFLIKLQAPATLQKTFGGSFYSNIFSDTP